VQPPATFFLQPNTRIEPFSDPRVREALGISVDRVFAFEEVIPTGLSVVDSLSPPAVTDPYPGAQVRWADEPLEARRERAVALLQEAGFGPDNPLSFEFAYPSGDVSNRVAPVIQTDWNSLADWIEVEIFGSESAVHYQNLGAADFEIALGGWNAVIRDTSYMLDVIKAGAAGNFVGWSDPRVEALLSAARDELNPQARAGMLREAEQIALDDFAITPFYGLERAWVVHPRLEGWVGGSIEYTPSHMLCLAEAE
jgi:oligopeptide transport system substrate-binding protein